MLQSIADERGVLAGLAQFGNDAYVDVSDLINIHSFSNKDNQIFYKCLVHAIEDKGKIDIPSVLAAATELGLYEAVNKKSELEYLRGLFQLSVKLDNVRKFAGKLKKLEIARNIQLRLKDAYDEIDKITGNESIDHILGLAETPIFDISAQLNKQVDEKPTKLFSEGHETLEFLANNKCDYVGIPTGFPVYDTIIGGGQRHGSVNLLVARPKTGKSTWVKCIGLYVGCKLDIPVLILDTEMKKNDILYRSLASETNIFINKIETGQFAEVDFNKNKLLNVCKSFRDKPLYYKSVAGLPFDEILSIIRRWVVQEVGYDDNGKIKNCLILYDYFKLMDSADLNKMAEHQVLGFQISKLTDFCNSYSIPCLATVQSNRDGIDKESTDVISQSDRLLWLCGSASFFKRKTPEEMVEDGYENGNMKLIPLECRYGPGLDYGDYINFQMNGSTSSLKELCTRKQAQKKKREAIETEDNVLGD